MSWNLSLIGKPENVAKAIEEEQAELTGLGKALLDAAAPHIIALVKENFQNQEGVAPPVIKLSASGSGFECNGEQLQRQCTVNIEGFYEKLV